MLSKSFFLKKVAIFLRTPILASNLCQYLEKGLPKIVPIVKMKKISLQLHRRDKLFCEGSEGPTKRKVLPVFNVQSQPNTNV